jgi:hypothetical protein
MRHETGSTGEAPPRPRQGALYPFDTSGAPGLVASLAHKDLRVVAFPILLFNESDSPKPIEHHAINVVVFAPQGVTVLRRHQHQINSDGLSDFWVALQAELAKPIVGEQQLDDDAHSCGSITYLRALMGETLDVERHPPRALRSLFARYRANRPTLRGLEGVEFECAVIADCWADFDAAVYEAMGALDDDIRTAAISRPNLSINVIARLLRAATTQSQTRNIQQAIRCEAIGLLAVMCCDTSFGKAMRKATLEGESLYCAHLQFGFPKSVVRLLRKNASVWITELQYFVAAQALSSLPSRYWPRDLDEIAAFSELLRLLLSRVNDVEFPGTIIALSYPLPLGLCPNRFLDELFEYLSAVKKMCRRLGHTNVKKLEILRAVDGVWFLFRHRDLASFEKESADIQSLIHHDGLLVTVVSHVLHIPVDELAAPLIAYFADRDR